MMSIRYFVYFILSSCLILYGASPTFSANYDLITDFGTSADMISIGNIQGFSDSSSAIFDNPAALHTIKTFSMDVFSSTVFTEVTYQTISLAFPLLKGTVGLGYMSSGVEDIPVTYLDGNGFVQTNTSFSVKSSVGKLAYSFPVTFPLVSNSYLALGASYYSNQIHTTQGVGWSTDLGIYSRLFQSENSEDIYLDMSFYGNNLYPYKGKIKYTDTADTSYSAEETLPFNVALGLKGQWMDLSVFVQGKHDGTNTLASGGLRYRPFFLDLISFSGGYKEFTVLGQRKNSVTLGTGIHLGAINFYYAYEKSTHPDFDALNYFSFNVIF